MRKNIRYFIQIVIMASSILLLCGVNIGKAEDEGVGGKGSASYEDLIKRNLELRANLEAVNNKYMALEEERNAFILHIRQLQKEKESLREAAIGIDSQSAAVKESKVKIEEVNKAFDTAIKERDALVKELEDSKTALNKMRESMADKSESKDEEIVSLKKEGKELRVQLERLEKELEIFPSKLAREVNFLKAKNADLEKQVKKLKKENGKFKSETAVARILRNKAEKEKSFLEKELKKKIEGPKKQVNLQLLRLHYNLAVALDEAGKYNEAEKEYLEVLKIDPLDVNTHYNLGVLYDDRLNKNKLALKHYKKYLELRPLGEDAVKVRIWVVSCEEEDRIGAEVK